MSDLEGDWDKLVDLVDRSPALRFDDEGQLHLNDGFALVYGGDAMDRGAGSRRLLQSLVDCFDRENHKHPQSVTLLVGNRDANKLRLPFELGPFASTDRPAELKRIFSKTMGAAQAFEFRREELAEVTGHTATDSAIVDSFLEDLSRGGALYEYLRRASIAHVQDTALFVHGAVGPQSYGYVPGRSDRLDDPERWVDALDEFYQSEFEKFTRNERPDALLRYQAPAAETPGRNPKSVIYGRYNDPSGNPELPPVALREKLVGQGLRWVVSGHTPGGDAPVPLASPEGIHFIMGDMSVAKMPGDILISRTEAICAAGVVDENDEAHVFTMQLWADETPVPIGRRHADGWVARGTIEDARWWVGRVSLPGYRIEQQALEIDEGNDGWEFAEPGEIT